MLCYPLKCIRLHITAMPLSHKPRYEIQLGRRDRFSVGLTSWGLAEFNMAEGGAGAHAISCPWKCQVHPHADGSCRRDIVGSRVSTDEVSQACEYRRVQTLRISRARDAT